MEDEIEIIKNNVDLESYSSSPGFLGYCQSKGGDYIEDCKKTIDILDENFNLDALDSLIVTSLFFDKNVLYKYSDFTEVEYEKYYKSVIKKDVAYEVDVSSSIYDFESPEYDLMIKNLINSFRKVQIPNKNFIKEVLHAFMTLDGFDGHFFLLLKDESLIIYPHDDFGVGFIAYGDSMSELMPKLKTRLKAMFEDEPNIDMHVWDKEKRAYN